MTDAPINLMQDGAWLVDQEGRRVAMVHSYGVVRPASEWVGVSTLRALVAWLEQQEASRER